MKIKCTVNISHILRFYKINQYKNIIRYIKGPTTELYHQMLILHRSSGNLFYYLLMGHNYLGKCLQLLQSDALLESFMIVRCCFMIDVTVFDNFI